MKKGGKSEEKRKKGSVRNFFLTFLRRRKWFLRRCVLHSAFHSFSFSFSFFHSLSFILSFPLLFSKFLLSTMEMMVVGDFDFLAQKKKKKENE